MDWIYLAQVREPPHTHTHTHTHTHIHIHTHTHPWAKYLVYGQLLVHVTPFLLNHDAQPRCWLDNSYHCETHGWLFHLMSGEIHEPPSSMLASPLVIKRVLSSCGFVVIVPSRFYFTITSPTADLGNLRRVAVCLTDFLLIWQPICSPRSKSLSSPDLPMLLVLLSNEQYTDFCLLLYQ
jgi:hypothetical protein